MYIQRKRKIVADDEMEMFEEAAVDVTPEAADLLFEAEDVAELVAEVTGEEVSVDTSEEGDIVEFEVGDEVFTVEAEGDEEILESVRRPMRGKRPVKASRSRRRNVRASRRVAPRKSVPARRGRR